MSSSTTTASTNAAEIVATWARTCAAAKAHYLRAPPVNASHRELVEWYQPAYQYRVSVDSSPMMCILNSAQETIRRMTIDHSEVLRDLMGLNPVTADVIRTMDSMLAVIQPPGALSAATLASVAPRQATQSPTTPTDVSTPGASTDTTTVTRRRSGRTKAKAGEQEGTATQRVTGKGSAGSLKGSRGAKTKPDEVFGQGSRRVTVVGDDEYEIAAGSTSYMDKWGAIVSTRPDSTRAILMRLVRGLFTSFHSRYANDAAATVRVLSR